MKTLKLKCKCGQPFIKELREYNRQIKNGRQKEDFYCSLKCSGKYSVGLDYFKKWAVSSENKKHLNGYCNNRLDEFSPYKEHLRRANRRSPNKKTNLTPEYLKEIFEKQNGKCVYSGVDLLLNDNSNHIFTASLDRIDSNKGYEIGNVQWTSIVMNYAKQSMSHEQTKQFINEVRKQI